VETRFINCSSS